MRILTFRNRAYDGGNGRRFVELVEGLAGRGHEVLVVGPDDYQSKTGARFHKIETPTGRFRSFRVILSVSVANALKESMQRFKPDVVFTFNLMEGTAAGIASRKFEIPSVLFVRGMELVLTNNASIPMRDLPVISHVSKRLYANIFRFFSRRAFRNSTKAVFQHADQRSAYEYERMIDRPFPCKVAILPNNSCPSWTRDWGTYKPQANHSAVAAANLYWNKGFRIVLDAFRIVRQRVPGAQLTIYGDGPQGESIRNYAREIPGVAFPGHQTCLGTNLQRFRVLVHGSLEELGSPNLVLEAAGISLPMLISDEMTHTVGAYLGTYPGTDHERLAALWIRVLTDDLFHQQLMEASSIMGERFRFDWVEAAERILQGESG